MKKLLVLLLLACCLLLVACQENEPQAPIPEEETNIGSVEIQCSAVDVNENMASQFLNGEITVDNFDDKENITVSEIGYFGTPSRYTLVDLDEDGARELVVVFAPSEDRVIIDITENAGTAYYLPIRTYNDIKKDGTANWSASAFENGIHKIRFTDTQVEFEEIILRNTHEGVFVVNGKEVSEEECNAALTKQHEKESVEWIDIE